MLVNVSNAFHYFFFDFIIIFTMITFSKNLKNVIFELFMLSSMNVIPCRWTPLAVIMYLLRRNPQNHQENDSSQKDAKVIFYSDRNSRNECIIWFFFSHFFFFLFFLLYMTKFSLYYGASMKKECNCVLT